MDYLKEIKKKPNLTVIATDFDGTISIIQADQRQATIDQELKNQLSKLQSIYRVISVISGRRAKQLSKLVGLKGVYYIGNHGAEYLTNSKYHVNKVALQAATKIENIYQELASFSKQGYLLDNKKYSLSIHYRTHPNPDMAQQQLQKILNKYQNNQLKIQRGRMVYDISPKNVDKGLAVEYLVKHFGAKNILYIGDDRTDVDAFEAMKDLSKQGIHTVCVALASNESPPELLANADLTLNSHKELKELFEHLL